MSTKCVFELEVCPKDKTLNVEINVSPDRKK